MPPYHGASTEPNANIPFQPEVTQNLVQYSGADPGILVRGGVDFFFQRPFVGPGQRPCGSQGVKPPDAPGF